MKRALVVVLGTLVASGCGTPPPDYLSWSKETALEKGGRSGDVDVCQARGWYSDTVCDTFCPAPDPACKPPASVCMSDNDCGEGQKCDTSGCLSCCPDAPAGTSCVAACCGVCKDDAPAYAPCMADADCAQGEVCSRTECLSCCPDALPGTACVDACCGRCAPAPTGSCAQDSDCRSGAEWCVDGKCAPCDNSGIACKMACPNGMVEPRNGCQPCQCRPAYTACMSDRECDGAQGEVCDMTECLSCCPNADPGTPCIAACCGKCSAAPTQACKADADCAGGKEWCVEGKCVPCDNSGLACDLWCPGGMVEPRNGCQPCACKPSYVACMADADCAAGEVCSLAECLSCCPDADYGTGCIDACCGKCAPAPATVCKADADCAAGKEWCVDGKCAPCDNSGILCKVACANGMVEPRNGCQPCECKPSYTACFGDGACAAGEVCDLTSCLSCCPDAPPGTACIEACCGKCAPAPTKACKADAECASGKEWCVDGLCAPCDNSGLACFLACPDGMVEPRNGCQPCQCKPSYVACFSDLTCAAGQVCDLTECLSCCPDAPPGSACIAACCGKCAEAPTKTCQADADCTSGQEWCEAGKCVPCDNSGLACKIGCTNGMVDPRNGCQPCQCKPAYVPCLGDNQCATGQTCNTSQCLSCCPDAAPGEACVAACCGKCE